MSRTERDVYQQRLAEADAEVAEAAAAHRADPTNYGFRLWALYGAPGRRRDVLAAMSDDDARALGVKADRDAEVARRAEGRQRAGER